MEKKKIVAKYSSWMVEKKIRKHSLPNKISPKAHPALTEYLKEVVQVRERRVQDLVTQ